MDAARERLQEKMMGSDTSQGCRSEGEEGRRGGHPGPSTAGAAGRRGLPCDFSGPCGLWRRPLVVFLQAFFQRVTQELQLLGGLAHPQLSLAGRRSFLGGFFRSGPCKGSRSFLCFQEHKTNRKSSHPLQISSYSTLCSHFSSHKCAIK